MTRTARNDAVKAINDLFASWELRVQQARRDDRLSPGSEEEFRTALYSYVASALRAVAKECDGWTKRCDDAKRIPDVIRDIADQLNGKSF